MRNILVVCSCLLALAGPAQAAGPTCWSADNGDRIKFLNNGEAELTITPKGHRPILCTAANGENGPDIACDAPGPTEPQPYFFVTATRTGGDRILIFAESAWYREACPY